MKKVFVPAYACLSGMASEAGNGWYYSSLVSQPGHRVWCLTGELGRSRTEQKLRVVLHPNLPYHLRHAAPLGRKTFRWDLIRTFFHFIYWQWCARCMAWKLGR